MSRGDLYMDFLEDSKLHWFTNDVRPDNYDLKKLRETQRCDEFYQLMLNRLVMGAFRYGDINKQNFDSYDMLSECNKRIELFKKDNNLEHLVDACNMIMLKFFWERKNGAVLIPQDDKNHSTKKDNA